jgi:hypothetical protein
MNSVAVHQPGLPAATFYCGAPSARLDIPNHCIGRERAGITRAKMMASAIAVAAIIAIGMSDAQI